MGQQATCTLSVLTKTIMYGNQSHKGNLQLASRIMKNYESVTTSGNTNVFNKNKKKELKNGMDFVAIKKNPGKNVIHDVQDMARTILVDAKARCPNVVHLSLWPYAMRVAINIIR